MNRQDRIDDDFDDEDDQQMLEFISQENKRLHIMVKKQNKDLKNLLKQCQQLQERHKIIKQHSKNVEEQKIHLQGLIDTKQKQIESQNHLKQVRQREIGRLESEMRKLQKYNVQFQQRLNQAQVRIHKTQEKSEQLKLQLNWNQQELEQWIMVTKQKQEDNVDLQRYKKQDQIKIRQLNLQIQKLTMEVARKQNDLQREITQTQTSQIQLDKTAEQFKKLHDQRHKLFEKWQQVTKNITKRNDDIQNLAMYTADIKAQITEQNQILQAQKQKLSSAARQNKQSQMRAEFLMRQISEKKNQNKKIQFQSNTDLQAQVQILKNKLSSDATQLVSKRNKIALLNQQLLTKKQRLNNEQKKYSAHQIKLKNQLKLAEKFSGSKNDAEARLKQNQLEKKAVQGKYNIQKEILKKSTAELFKLKQNEVSLYGQIQGNIAACKNLQSHINKLNQQFQRQQQLLYNAEYQIQLMERKVARAKGERTLQQKKDLQKQIDKVAEQNIQIKSKHKILVESVKRLDEDLRGVQNSLTSVKQTQKHYTSVIQELSLENEMTAQDLNKVSKKKEQVLVQHDIMKLQIKKIKMTLSKATDNVYSLENKKNQMEMSMQQRQKQIQVHKDILLAQFKAAEDERHKIAIELAERSTKVKNLKIKYEALVQKNHGGNNQSVAEHSQAYYVIKAAQERQQLQRKGDQLSAKIIRAQKQLKALQYTLVTMKSVNVKIKDTGLRRGIAKQDLQQKSALQQQLNSASDTLHNKRHQIGQKQRNYQQDMRRYTQIRNKVQNLDDRRKKLSDTNNQLKKQLTDTLQSKTKALKSLGIIQKDPRNKGAMNPANAQIAQLQYEIEKQKNKILFGSLLSLVQQIPDIAVALEQSLRTRQIELPHKPPSSIDLMSSKQGSVRSGRSQVSHQSQNSQMSRQSRQSQNSRQSNVSGQSNQMSMRQSQQSQGSRVSGISGLSGSAIGRVTGMSRNPR